MVFLHSNLHMQGRIKILRGPWAQTPHLPTTSQAITHEMNPYIKQLWVLVSY